MKTKTILLIVACVTAAIPAADLAWGNTNNAVLPEFLTNNLTQEGDIALLAMAAVTAWFAVSIV